MRKVLTLLLAFTLLMGVSGCGGEDGQPEKGKQSKVKLGIIQIVEHPALDATRKGFLDYLAEKGYASGEQLDIDYQNAQGDQANLQIIARKLVQNKSDLILAIATPSAVAMASETSDIPILIASVTDPVGAKLVKSSEKPETNITGTSDLSPVADQIKLIKEIVPDVKKVGTIYNSSEINSQIQVGMAEKAAAEQGLQVVKVSVTATSEVSQAAQSLVGRADVIYLGLDNMVCSALPTIIQVAEKNKMPIFVSDTEDVEKGAVATLGVDYYQLGRVTGEMALQIINGKKPQEMPIRYMPGENLVVNLPAAERMGAKIPEQVIARAHKVIK